MALLRKLGADYVLDTTFAADMTIMQEAGELVESALTKGPPSSSVYQLLSCLGEIIRGRPIILK